MSFFRFHEISQKAYSEVLPLFNSPEFFSLFLQENLNGLITRALIKI